MARPSSTEEKRAELLLKATECFRRHGYDKTSLDDIARAMKLNKASLYYYIKNKEDLFLEVIVSEASKALNGLLAETDQIEDPMDKICYFFNKKVDAFLHLIKLNSISKDMIISLYGQFIQAYQDNIDTECDYLAAIISEENLADWQGQELETNVRLLFDVCTAMKHDAVLLGNVIEGDESDLATVRKNTERTIQMFLIKTPALVM
jgi:AcrR family transcriptional regulator